MNEGNTDTAESISLLSDTDLAGRLLFVNVVCHLLHLSSPTDQRYIYKAC